MTPEMEKAIAKAKAIARAISAKGGDDRKVIATTPDGGEVFRAGDGSLSFKSPGYATNDPETIKRIMEGEGVKQIVQEGFDREVLGQAPVRARVQELAQGAPLVGEWFDESIEGVNPDRARNSRILSDAMERQNPVESGALNVAGGVLTTLPVAAAMGAGKAADWVARGSSRLSQFGRAATVGGLSGAAGGASSFAGRSEPGSRVSGAATGAVIGGGLGASIGALAPLLGEGVSSLARRVKRLDVKDIAEQFGLSRPAARVVKGYLANDDLAAAGEILRRGGDDVLLAEAGPATRQALDTAMATGGDALATARPRVDARVQIAGQKWVKTLDHVLGEAEGGIKGASKAISRRTASERSAAYNKAYAQPTPTVGQAADDIQDAVSRIPPRILRSAIEKANDAMRARGEVNMNILASVDDAGEVTFKEIMNVQQLDQIKRALSEIVDEGTDPLTGKMSSDARLAAELATNLRDALKEHIPGYARALNLGGDTIRENNALVMGRKLLNESTTVEDVRSAMSGASIAEREAAKKGLRENLEALMGRARATIADLEAGNIDFDTGQNDVAQAVAAIRSLTSKNNVQKARAVLGSDASRLFSELERVGDALVLRAAVARNSATAIRQAGQEAMRAEVAPGLVRETAGNLGSPFEAAKSITQTVAGIDPTNLSRQEAQYFAEIADALTRIKGDEARKALTVVRKAMAGQPIKEAEAELIGRVVSGAGAVGAYRGLTQPLRPQ